MLELDSSKTLTEKVRTAAAKQQPLTIRAGGSKDFLGVISDAEILDTSAHQGIVSYEPTELVITARAGTTLQTIEQTLTKNGQMLAFEPPCYNANATIGGTVATSLSGPGRPYLGAVRDHVLGCRIINGYGQTLRFGGEVMKNVAGYDVTRLMTGAMGTLGVLLDISFKVIPIAEQQITLRQPMDCDSAIVLMQKFAAQSPLVTAAAWYNGELFVRIAGVAAAIDATASKIGGEKADNNIWHQLRDHNHAFFNQAPPLWRISVPPLTPALDIDGDCLYDWAGTQRWYYTHDSAKKIRQAAQQHHGHAQLFKASSELKQQAGVFHPQTQAIEALHKKIKREFDPHGIFNLGRLYHSM